MQIGYLNIPHSTISRRSCSVEIIHFWSIIIFNAAINHGEVIGVIPKALALKEVAHKHLTQLHITESMHERKMMMAELSDGFIALPGGIGTLEELFEIWTWAQLGFHNKPCGLLNINGYYDSLIGFLDHVLAEQFLKKEHHAMLLVETNPNTLLDRYSNYQPPAIRHWVSKDEI